MPDTSVKPPATMVDKLTGAATFAATNGATFMGPAVPGNELGIGGLGVNGIALAVNALIQQAKMHDWFKQDKHAIWVGIVVVVALCMIVWLQESSQKAILNACDAIGLFLTNYGPLKNIKILGQGTDA